MFAEEVAFRFFTERCFNHARFETSEAERHRRALARGFARRILMNRDQRGNADSFLVNNAMAWSFGRDHRNVDAGGAVMGSS